MTVNNLYYNKYIKYKNKYLNLQSQMGGVNPPPPPPLIKQNSTFISCHGHERTCWAHGSTMLIMKLITNFFPKYFLPLQINDCNHYYDTLKCNIYTIFDCFLQIKKGNINCKSSQGDKKDWSEENFYALLFHFIFSTLVEQYKIANGVFSVEAICLYILDYLKYIDITEDAFEKKTFYNKETGYNIDEQLYFNELITKSVELFKDVKKSLNNKNFNPIIYRFSSVAHELYSISKYQYYTQEFKCMFNDYERMPKKEISFKDKRANRTGFSSKLENLNPVYTNEYNLRNITGKTDLPTNIKYVLDQHYYALFYTGTHVIIITECTEEEDNLFLHIKNLSIIDTCSKEEPKTWCNLIEDNKISMNKLLHLKEIWNIVFFYPYEFFDKQIIDQFNQNTTVKFIKQIIEYDKGKKIANALMKNKTVTELSFYQCTISDNAKKAIAEALKKNTTLEKIIFLYTNIGDDGAKAIAEALEQNTTLTEIVLNNNMIGTDGAKAIAKALKINAKLETINLTFNKMMGDNGATQIAEALKINEKLKTIHLTRNNMSKDGAKAIAEALEKNRTLTYIDLTYNPIGDDGTKEIAKALETNETLTKINLSNNKIGIVGATAIAEALKKKNTKLETFLLNYNNIGDDGAMAIVDALKQNTILKSFNISGNKITNKTKQNIKKSDVASRIIF